MIEKKIVVIDGKKVLIKERKDTGFIYEPEQEKDYIQKIRFNPDAPLGRLSAAPELPVIFKDGHGWNEIINQFKPEMQFNPSFDSFSCTIYSAAKALCAYAYKVYGVKFSIAEMYNAFYAGVVFGRGTSVRRALESFRLYGWVKDEDYPFNAATTQAQYFAEPPVKIQIMAKGKLTEWQVHWEQLDYSGSVPHSVIANGLRYSSILCSGFAWASDLGEGVYYDYNNPPNHLFCVSDWSNDEQYDLLANDSYPQDNKYDEDSAPEEFEKKLAKNYRIWSAHRIFLTPIKKKLTYKKMMEKIVMMIPGGAKFLVKPVAGVLKKQEIKNWEAAFAAIVDEVGAKTMSPADLAKIPDTAEFFPNN